MRQLLLQTPLPTAAPANTIPGGAQPSLRRCRIAASATAPSSATVAVAPDVQSQYVGKAETRTPLACADEDAQSSTTRWRCQLATAPPPLLHARASRRPKWVRARAMRI